MTPRMVLLLAGVAGALGIAVGAFGAHALPNLLKGLSAVELAERTDWLVTGNRYHMVHAVALLALALTNREWSAAYTIAAMGWFVGILVFSGCLYAMSLTGIRVLGAIVPLGGLSYIVGWLAVAFGPSAAR
jgi:uncharacterized membrane protein YgdD (TMEM256/DUF423 family)